MADHKSNDIHPATLKALLKTDPAPQVVRRDGSVHATGEVFDGGGLVLIVGKGRQRAWEFRYRFENEPRVLGLGSAHKVTLADARDAATANRALVVKKIDPKTIRDALKAERLAEVNKAAEPSFHACAAKAVLNEAICKVTGEAAQKQWVASMAPHLCADVTAKAPRNITREDVALVVEAIRARGSLTMANKVQGRMEAVFEWCAGHNLIPEDAANPAVFKGRQLIRLPKVKPAKVGHAMIPWRKLPEVIAGLRAKDPRRTALCCEWIALSGVRSSNATTAAKTEVDRVAKVWTVPASKMKEDGHGNHAVPLTDRHLEILDELARLPGANSSDLLFPGADDVGPQGQTMRQVLRAVYPHDITREDGSVRKASVHGLRAGFRTWGRNALRSADGGPKYHDQNMLLELCLAHVVGDEAQRAYIREDNVELRRAIMNDWAAFLATGEAALALAA